MRLNLSEMGIWSKRVRVELGGAYEEVVVRTLGDRTNALEYGHESMQKKLLEFAADGPRFAALGEALGQLPVEETAGFVAEGEREATLARLRREMPDSVEPKRDMAAGESAEDFTVRHETWEQECLYLAKLREEEAEARLSERREELSALPKDELISLARTRRIDIECWNAFQAAADSWVLYESTRKSDDPARAYFDTIEEVHRLHPEVRAQLCAAYCALEKGGGEGADILEADLPKG